MKVATIYINFLLPENFEGDFNDVLKEIIKYRESKNLSDLSKGCVPYTEEEMEVLQDAHRIYWGHFKELVLSSPNFDSRLHGSATVKKLTENGNWKDICQPKE